jgi:putative glutamine amidotransferase
MPRKVVGITCSTQPLTKERAPCHALNRAYVSAIEQAGGAALLLPVTPEPDVLESYLSVMDGLLLSGGVDVAPEHYGHAPHERLGEIDADRDATELPLIRRALAQDVPIFAICRGIQALNVAMGGTLYQDLPSEKPSSIRHRQTEYGLARSETAHLVHIEPGSRLHSIVGAEDMETNSLHHQALRDVAEGLVVTACAPDGVIEAAEAPAYRYVLGVQFHPEETIHDEKSRRLFAAFLHAL